MFRLGSHHHFPVSCTSIGLRLLLAITVTTALAQGQRQKDPEKNRQTEGDHRTAPREARKAGAPAASEAAHPQRTSGGAEQGQSRTGRAVGGTYNAPAANAPAPERQRPANPAANANSNSPQRNTGGFDRNANTNPPQRNTGGFDRNANTNPPQRNTGGFDRNANTNPPQRNTGGFDRNANTNPPQRNTGGFDRNANIGRMPESRANLPNRDTRTPRPEFTRDQRGRVETFRGRTGSEVRYRPDGAIGSVRRGDMTIQRGAGNSRRIIVQRADRTRIVTNRSGHGFVQRPFAHRGQEFINRTYYLRGQTYSRYYRPYSYRGMMLNSYVPTRYYHSGFYSWFSRPWSSPISFAWGWMGASWFGYYRGYFAPYPYYASPSYWLTDYVLSARLAEAYVDNPNAPPLYGATMLAPSVKQAISMEVEQQLAAERADADVLARNEIPDPQAGFPRLLADGNPHVFVVSFSLDVADAAGGGCSISRGDVIRLSAPLPANASSAYLEVIASKPGSCRIGTTISVGLEDLQDFYNQMRETLSQGVDELRSKAGMNGMPALPANVNVTPRSAQFVDSAPPPDTQVANELKQEVQTADQLEREATQEATDANQNPAAPVTISLGQTTEQVVGMLGNPKQIVNLGTKQLYVYDRMKITFVAGKVTDVE